MEYALASVPQQARASSMSIATMLLAGNISLPVLVMGGQLGLARGFGGTVAAACGGGLLLALLAAACAYVGARSRLTTYLLIVRAFGAVGGEAVNLILTCSVVGWFSVVLMLFAHTLARMAGGPSLLWVAVGTMLMVGTTVVGFRALTWLSNVLLPAKLGLLIWAVSAAIRAHGAILPGTSAAQPLLDGASATSFVVGGWVVGAVVAPDFSRFARQVSGGALACAVALGIGYPLVLIAASIPALLTGNTDFLAIMADLNLGVAALIIVLLASWTGGAINLYCGSLMLATVFRRTPRSLLIWGSAAVGMILGMAGIIDRLIPYLTMLSLIVPAIAGVYLPCYVLGERRGIPPSAERVNVVALLSFAIGVATAGIAQWSGRGLTGIGAIDSVLASAAAYLLFDQLRVRWPERPPADA